MPLPPSAPRRARHRRAIDVQAFERGNGLWDIEACLTDCNARDTQLATGVRPTELPIYKLRLPATIDRQMNVVDAQSPAVKWVSYLGHGEDANSSDRALIGLDLRRGLRHAVTEHLGEAADRAHLTNLRVLSTSATLQACVGEVSQTGVSDTDAAGDVMPFQLDRCHALKLDDGPWSRNSIRAGMATRRVRSAPRRARSCAKRCTQRYSFQLSD
ncbi:MULTISPECIES: DUF2889 domain-containing protein [Mycetohabitans]|uniref:Uncharacterized protein n=1 Tax=Mycetohabitans endofungorum TaxID=417203 RepID=A0A2P5KCR0_9BURK|nr:MULTISPECIES: DUF2889 domain-containing protein [Mycetohabitans]PPB84490.1 Protein of unknown function (DUF2889) [Mycetohabitans endofungorum]